MTRARPTVPAAADERSLPAVPASTQAIVVWRGERVAFDDLPDRIATTEDRDEREGLFRAYLEALEALNPRWTHRLRERTGGPSTAAFGLDPADLASDLERFVLHTETPYYAALRRYLALIGIEQGDGTVADLWHIARGTAWAQWFGERDAMRAIGQAGRPAGDAGGLSGWLAAERALRGAEGRGPGEVAVGEAWATVVGSPQWVEGELGMAGDQVVPYVDFATFVRLWRVREAIARLHYELRLTKDPDPDLARPYYHGIIGHTTGVLAPEEMYLVALEGEPFTSARDVVAALLGACLIETLENRHGPAWWREPGAADLIDLVSAAGSIRDALAQVGYDALDWRPLLRQIRTRLIGEMSGYGGPNITTRAGTRKV